MSIHQPGLSPTQYASHPLHDDARLWPLTNCYIDLWIEVLASRGLDPLAMFGFTLEQDFEGDQFTFSKPPAQTLAEFYGAHLQELAIYDDVREHLKVQLARGRVCLVEVDSYFLPDTAGLTYRCTHGKTTIAANRIDVTARRLEYFHNGGYHVLSDEDFDGLFRGYAHDDTPFLPYAEFVKFEPSGLVGQALRERAKHRLFEHLSRAPSSNPVTEFQAVLPHEAQKIAGRGQDFFHLYAFNTLRQLGANHELLADHLQWLDSSFATAAEAARQVAKTAKAAQFQLARACARGRFEPLAQVMVGAVEAYDVLRDGLEQLSSRQ